MNAAVLAGLGIAVLVAIVVGLALAVRGRRPPDEPAGPRTVAELVALRAEQAAEPAAEPEPQPPGPPADEQEPAEATPTGTPRRAPEPEAPLRRAAAALPRVLTGRRRAEPADLPAPVQPPEPEPAAEPAPAEIDLDGDDTPWRRGALMAPGASSGAPIASVPEPVPPPSLGDTRVEEPPEWNEPGDGPEDDDWTGWADWDAVDAEVEAETRVPTRPAIPPARTDGERRHLVVVGRVAPSSDERETRPARAAQTPGPRAGESAPAEPAGAAAPRPTEPAAARPVESAPAVPAQVEPPPVAAARPSEPDPVDRTAGSAPVGPIAAARTVEPATAHHAASASRPVPVEPTIAAAQVADTSAAAPAPAVPPPFTYASPPIVEAAPAPSAPDDDPAAAPPDPVPARQPRRPLRTPAEQAAEQAAADLGLLRTFGYADPSLRPDTAPVVSLVSRAGEDAPAASGDPQPVRFRATDHRGKPVGQAAVSLLDDRGQQVAAAVADAAGGGELLAPHPGAYVLVARAPGHQAGASAVTVADAAATAEVVLIRSAAVHGVVLGEDGPIACARVTLVQDGEIVDAVDTGADGAYRLDDVISGEYGLSVAAAGCEPFAGLAVVPDETDLRRDVELEPALPQADQPGGDQHGGGQWAAAEFHDVAEMLLGGGQAGPAGR